MAAPAALREIYEGTLRLLYRLLFVLYAEARGLLPVDEEGGYGRYGMVAVRRRVEHEDNANTMGETAGRNMAGARRRYDHLPFFYSDLFELGYEAVGDLSARHQILEDWKEKFREGVIYYLDGGRVRGVLLWNTWGQVDAARALIADPGPFRPEQLKGRLPDK